MRSVVVRFAILATLATSLEGASDGTLELRGKVLYSATRSRMLRIAIFRVESPYSDSTFTDPGGTFHFRNLLPGNYTLSVIRRGLGEVRRSVVVTPTLADKKGVVRVEIPFSPSDAALGGNGATVSRKQLTIPFKATVKYAEAERRLNKHDVKGAEKLLSEAVKVAPQYAAAWNFLGVLAFQQHDLVKAEEYFRRALQVERESFEPSVNLGGILMARRQHAEALALNQKAVELRPKDALANAQLGMTYYNMGRFDEALPYLETAKATDPAHFTRPQLYIAVIRERRGDKAAAMRELQDLLAIRPDAADADMLRRRLRRLQASVNAPDRLAHP